MSYRSHSIKTVNRGAKILSLDSLEDYAKRGFSVFLESKQVYQLCITCHFVSSMVPTQYGLWFTDLFSRRAEHLVTKKRACRHFRVDKNANRAFSAIDGRWQSDVSRCIRNRVARQLNNLPVVLLALARQSGEY